jgi:electron transport complex protein RnfG
MATNDGSPLKTLLLVAVIATAAAAIVSASWEFSRERIAANRRARLIDNLNSVLDADLAGRNLNPMALSATDPDLLGQEGPVDVFVPMQGDQAVAAIFGTVAPHGYNAPIHLLIGISAASGQIMGVRVVSHRETPGLGDQIEIRKSNWILQFDGRTIESPDTAG